MTEQFCTVIGIFRNCTENLFFNFFPLLPPDEDELYKILSSKPTYTILKQLLCFDQFVYVKCVCVCVCAKSIPFYRIIFKNIRRLLHRYVIYSAYLLRSQPSSVVTSCDHNYKTMKHVDSIIQLYFIYIIFTLG